MSQVYVGLDAGSISCHFVGVDSSGAIVFDRKVPTSGENLLAAICEISGDLHIHLEASTLAGWIQRLLLGCVKRVVISHPRSNKWIACDAHKCDRIDAFKLAELLRMNRLHPVYYPEDPQRAAFKSVVQQYDYLTRHQVRIKLRIKAMFRGRGVFPRGDDVYSMRGRDAWLTRIPREAFSEDIEYLYELLDATLKTQKKVRLHMSETSKRFPEVQIFQEVPGVGVIGACRFSAYIQDPFRFTSKRKLWRYCGLGIVDRSSDGKSLGRRCLDRSGVLCLKDMSRKAFVGAMRTREENALRSTYEAALRRTHNAVHARLTVQRKVLSILLRMWKENSHYRPNPG